MNEFVGIIEKRKNPGKNTIKIDAKRFDIYKKNNIAFLSAKKGVQYKGCYVLINGAISDIFSEKYKLEEYENNQEKLIFEMYKRYKEKFISFLDGYFVIVIYDEAKKRLLVYNNHYLISTVYYYVEKEKLIFSSNLRNILQNLDEKPELNKKSVVEYLNNGFFTSDQTLFQNIAKLEPNYYLLYQNKKVFLEKYYDMKFNRKSFKDLSKHIDKYEELIKNGIKNFLKYNKAKKVGCLLSGGHDTSYMTAMTAKVYPDRLHTFTAYYKHELFDEKKDAKEVSDKFNAIHHPILITEKAFDYIPAMTNRIEEPGESSCCLGMYMCTLEAKKYVDTIITGDGGDNLYGQFFSIAEVYKRFSKMPLWFRKLFYNIISLATEFIDKEKLWTIKLISKLFTEKNIKQDFYRKLITYRYFDDEEKKKLISKAFISNIKMNPLKYKLPLRDKTFFNDLLYANIIYGVVHNMIPYTSRAFHEQGINFYPPYFNNRVVDFINSLPEKWLVRGNSFQRMNRNAELRYFHKRAMLRYFDKKFVYRPEKAFIYPLDAWFKKRPELLRVLIKSLIKRGYYNKSYLIKIFNDFHKQKISKKYPVQHKDHGRRIFTLLNLEVWCKEFLDDIEKRQRKGRKIIPIEKYLERSEE